MRLSNLASRLSIAALAVLVISAFPAGATISSYANLAAWQAGNPTSTLQDFNSISTGTTFNPYSTVTDGTIQASNNVNGGGSSNTSVVSESTPSFGTGQYLVEGGITETDQISNSAYTYQQNQGCSWGCNSGSVAASTSSFTEVGQITFTPPTGTEAMAFDAGQFESYLSQAHKITATVTTTDNQQLTETISNTFGQLSFFGFKADNPIASVTLTVALSDLNNTPTITRAAGTYQIGQYSYDYSSDSTQALDYSELGVDNLMVGFEQPVPEPASWALLFTVGAVVLRIYRKQRATVIGN